jgi:NADH-quinone oxidoreductase subunit E
MWTDERCEADVLTDAERHDIENEIAASWDKRAACISALRAVQARRGWISDEAIRDIAAMLEMSTDELDAVATFYHLIYRHPVGKHVVKVCDGAVCWILGSRNLMQYLEQKLEIESGGTTGDGLVTLLPICCVGDCDHAPVMMVDDTTIRDLTPERIDELIASRFEVGG